MKTERIHTLILVSKEGIHKCFRFKKVFRNANDQLILEIKDGEQVHRMVVTQTEDGITNLMGDEGENYRILGLSHCAASSYSEEEIFNFRIAESLQNALDLYKFI